MPTELFGNGPVYNAREELKNADLFLRFGLASTLIRDDNRTFSKRSSNRRNLKTPALHFLVDGKRFENSSFFLSP